MDVPIDSDRAESGNHLRASRLEKCSSVCGHPVPSVVGEVCSVLVLRRKEGESIVLNGVITVTILAVEGERVKIGIAAPPDVIIVREELLTEGGLNTPPMSSPRRKPKPTPPPQEPEDDDE